ncbi:MAG: glycosyltransferase family 2 protein [Pseudomonadota bacterium]
MQSIPYNNPAFIASVDTKYSLSIVVPVFNESECLSVFHNKLCSVLTAMSSESFQIIYVNDGSSDNSWDVIKGFKSSVADIVRINLSKNFGKEAAMTAGLDHTSGKAVAILDADLQDPPELIPNMLKKIREGYDVVNMSRRSRQGESLFKRICAGQFYRVLSWIADSDVVVDVGDFRMMSRRVVDAIIAMPERNRYMKGIMSWPGFHQTTLSFHRPERIAGETKWSFFQLVSLALSGITAFSSKPLRFATFAGILVSLSAFTYAAWVFFKAVFIGEDVQGYSSIVLMILVLGGLQLLGMGIIGEYLSRLFTESKARPVYLIMEKETTSNYLAKRDAQGG